VVKPTVEHGFSYRGAEPPLQAPLVHRHSLPHDELEPVLQTDDADTQYVV